MAATEEGNGNTCDVTFVTFENPLQEHFEEHLPVFTKMITVLPHKFLMLSAYEALHTKHMEFPCYQSDVWVASFPKSGTTWLQELVWGLVRGLDHQQGDLPLMNRFPFFEWDALFEPAEFEAVLSHLPESSVERPGEQWRLLQEVVGHPRLIKTHLHRDLLPTAARDMGNKILYVIRDPRDVCISLFYHSVKLLNYTGNMDDFVKLFLADTYEFGPYWSNMLSYWRVRARENVLILKYEDLKQDLSGMITRVGKFLDVSVRDEHLAALVEHLSFDSMKGNIATNNETVMDGLKKESNIKFMRKGIVGDYKNHLNEDQIRQFKEWTEKWLKDSDFPYYRE